jgi:succinate dehydrogenase hydrophobic anchor subunit
MFASFAFYTRYASGIILVIIASMLFVYLIRSKQVKYLFIPVIIFAAVTLPDFFIRGRFIIWDVSDQQLHLSYFYVPKQWGILNYFKKDFSNLDGAQHYDYPNLLFAMQNWLHPAFIFCGIFFMLNLRKQDFNLNEIQWLLLATVAYLLFVAGYPYQSNRYLLLTFPFIIVMFYPAFLKIRQKYFHREALSKSIIAVLIFAQVFLFGYSIQIIYATNRNEKLIAQSVKNYPGKPIYTFSIDGALRTYGVQNTIIEIYSSRIDSVMPNSLLLFNYEHFYIQFEKLNPMINWERITDSNYLEQIEEFSNGWRLYAIKSKPFNDSF